MKKIYSSPAMMITNVAVSKMVCDSITGTLDPDTQIDNPGGFGSKQRHDEGLDEDPNGWTDGLW